MPEYADKVVFVSATTGTEAGDELAKAFSFRYIPMSFFLKPGGQIADSYAGPLTEEQMRARLDAIAAQ